MGLRGLMKMESLAAAPPSRRGKTSQATFGMETMVVWSLTVKQQKGRFLRLDFVGQEQIC